jgi:hypothetical protein
MHKQGQEQEQESEETLEGVCRQEALAHIRGPAQQDVALSVVHSAVRMALVALVLLIIAMSIGLVFM